MNLTVFRESYDPGDTFSLSPLIEVSPPKYSHCQVTGMLCAVLHDLELCDCHGRPVEWREEK